MTEAMNEGKTAAIGFKVVRSLRDRTAITLTATRIERDVT